MTARRSLLAALLLAGCAAPRAAPAAWPEDAPGPGPAPAPVAPRGAPLFHAEGQVGFARFEHRVAGRRDHATGPLLRGEFEVARPFGGGLRLEYLRTGDDLADNAEARTFDGFGYFLWRFRRNRFSLPLRGGAMFSTMDRGDFEDFDRPQPAEVDTRIVGARVEAGPEWTVVENGRERLHLFVEGSAAYGFARIDTDFPGLSDDFESEAFVGGFRAGLRAQVAKVTFGMSYVLRYTDVATSDAEDTFLGPQRFPDQQYVVSGVVLTVGARW